MAPDDETPSEPTYPSPDPAVRMPASTQTLKELVLYLEGQCVRQRNEHVVMLADKAMEHALAAQQHTQRQIEELFERALEQLDTQQQATRTIVAELFDRIIDGDGP